MWGRDRIGVGLLKALRAGQDIVFEDKPSPDDWVPSKGGHLVVCEEGEELSQIIAANYAFALDAGLFLIPEGEKDEAEDLLQAFSRIHDSNSTISPPEQPPRLSQHLLTLSRSL